jgi:thymidylate kinase
MSQTGKLFIFEGPDGSGKTTLSRSFAEHLNACDIKCEWFSFPGREPGTLGKHVYDIHHSAHESGIKKINAASLQLLHIAAHIDTIVGRIMPAIKNGKYTVLDRFWWSTFVYGVLAGAGAESLRAMIDVERLHWGKIRPERVFVLTRKAHIESEPGLEDSLLVKEYTKLAGQEARKYPVSVLANDGTLDEILSQITRLAGLGKKIQLLKNQAKLPLESTESSRPQIFSKLEPAKPTVVYDTYWRLAAERQAILFRRLRGDQPPWTNDPILREYKFTNAYRASDRTSQYLIRNVIYCGDQSPDEVFFRALLFKFFNRIETWELLTRKLGRVSYKEYSYTHYDAALTKAIDGGTTIYSAAYIMPSGGPSSFGRKHRMHLKLLEQMLKDDLPSRKRGDKNATNFDGELFSESLDSLYKFFQEARLIMRRFPVGRIKDFKQEHLGILINRVLANVLRPFLEKWNGQYRVWWARASKSDESPYEIQQKYPKCAEFLADWSALRFIMRRVESALAKEYKLIPLE